MRSWKHRRVDNIYFKSIGFLEVGCQRCPSHFSLILHHKDGNNQNNVFSNLEILCRSCHAKEHKHGFLRKYCKGNTRPEVIKYNYASKGSKER